MSLNVMQTAEVIGIMENFLVKRRPPEEIRDKLDLGYKIEDQSIIIYEIRPRYDDPQMIIESEIAKATYVKTQGFWKIYWVRADNKWHSYKPRPMVKTLQKFLDMVDEDAYGAFWG